MKLLSRLLEPGERRRLRRAFETLNDFARVVRSMERSYSDELAIKFSLFLLYKSCKALYTDLIVIQRELAPAGIPRSRAREANKSLSFVRKDFRELKLGFRDSVDAKRMTALDRPFEWLERAIQELYGPTTKFQRKFGDLMKKCGVTPYSRVMTDAISESYGNRLLRGERRNPSRGVVLAIASALEQHSGDNNCGLSALELIGLIKAAGYRPPRSKKWKP